MQGEPNGETKAKATNKQTAHVAEARRSAAKREQGYREQALKIYPWICGRCAREFTHANLRELTVHHKDHNHDNNPLDGSNWELLCIYCHENEHARVLDEAARAKNSGARDRWPPTIRSPICRRGWTQREGSESAQQDTSGE